MGAVVHLFLHSTGANFDKLPNLTEIILDKNGIEKLAGFPTMPKVVTLWINNNKIKDLAEFMDSVVKCVRSCSCFAFMLASSRTSPTYQCSRILRARMCTFQTARQKHINVTGCSVPLRVGLMCCRYYVIYRLKHLKFLDASPITPAERLLAVSVVF